MSPIIPSFRPGLHMPAVPYTASQARDLQAKYQRARRLDREWEDWVPTRHTLIFTATLISLGALFLSVLSGVAHSDGLRTAGHILLTVTLVGWVSSIAILATVSIKAVRTHLAQRTVERLTRDCFTDAGDAPRQMLSAYLNEMRSHNLDFDNATELGRVYDRAIASYQLQADVAPHAEADRDTWVHETVLPALQSAADRDVNRLDTFSRDTIAEIRRTDGVE